LLANLALSRRGLDRVETVRADPARLAQLWRQPTSRIVVLSGDYVAVDAFADDVLALRLIKTTAWSDDLPHQAMFLGLDEHQLALFAIDDASRPHIDGGRTLREIGSKLSARDAEVLTTVVALATWHRRHPRCPVCGTTTQVVRGGWVRLCGEDGSEHFPRTDPAVIMLVRDPTDRALLGRRVGWAPGWFSTLAGFVEPGESAECAVAREVQEESGIVVDPASVQFLGSQPWPFPSSLMLGFHAYSAGSVAPVADGSEMVEVAWFSREQVRLACSNGDLRLPPSVSIARRLVERWYGQELPGQWSR
jgi:NAD+ diphosphatase